MLGPIRMRADPSSDAVQGISGRSYYRARYYDPQTGRFLSEDPLLFEGNDTNFYRYVGNSPIGFYDPSGLQRLNSPRTGPPNSTAWFPNPSTGDGTVRVYGPNGEAVTDYDYGHDHTGAGDPHAHDWGKDKNGKPVRGKPRPIKPGEKVPPQACSAKPQPTPMSTPRPIVPFTSCLPGVTCHLGEDGYYHPGAYPVLPPSMPGVPIPAPSLPTLPIQEPVPVPLG